MPQLDSDGMAACQQCGRRGVGVDADLATVLRGDFMPLMVAVCRGCGRVACGGCATADRLGAREESSESIYRCPACREWLRPFSGGAIPSDGQEATIEPGESPVASVALEPDGKRAAYGDLAGTLWLAEERGRGWAPVWRDDAHGSQVSAVCCGRDLMATGGGDGRIRLWRNRRTAATLVGHAGNVRSLALSGNGHWLVSGGTDASVRLWDLGRKAEIARQSLPPTVAGVAIDPQGRAVAAAGNGITLLLRDDLQRRRQITDHSGMVHAVAFVGTKYVASGGEDCTARLWDVETGRQRRRFAGHKDAVLCLAVTGKGTQLVTGGRDGTVRLWDLQTGKELKCLLQTKLPVEALAASADAAIVLAALEGEPQPRACNTGASRQRPQGGPAADERVLEQFRLIGHMLQSADQRTLAQNLWTQLQEKIAECLFCGNTSSVRDAARQGRQTAAAGTAQLACPHCEAVLAVSPWVNWDPLVEAEEAIVGEFTVIFHLLSAGGDRDLAVRQVTELLSKSTACNECRRVFRVQDAYVKEQEGTATLKCPRCRRLMARVERA